MTSVADGLGLRLEGVTVGYREHGRRREVVRGIDVVARPGELTALLGPNGTGKSTLLRTIAGLQKGLGGSITLDGSALAGMSAAARARVQSIVLTERVAPGRFTGRELVGLGRHPHSDFRGRLTERDDGIIDESLAAVGATALAERDISELSDGERQRIMTARALAQQPRLLLMDEPSAFLDAPGRVALAGLVRRIATQQEVVVVISTHEVELMVQVADRLWLLDRSGNLHDGTPEDLVERGLLAQVFDSEDLAFDPVAGAFRLVTEQAGTVRVLGRPHSGLDHLLVRRGWQRKEAGVVDLEIESMGDQRWRVLRDGHIESVTGFADLAEALRQRPTAGAFGRVESRQVDQALTSSASIGPYFEVDCRVTGTALAELGVDRVRAWSEITCERIGTGELRVGLATWHFGVVARVWSALLGCWATSGVVPDMEHMGITDEGGRLRFTLASSGGFFDDGRVSADRVADLMLDVLLALTDPLHALLVRDLRMARGLLDGNRAAAAIGAVRALQRQGSRRDPQWLLTALVRHPALGPHLDVEFAADGCVTGHTRRSCCLFYRTERGGTCEDCPVRTTSRRPAGQLLVPPLGRDGQPTG